MNPRIPNAGRGRRACQVAALAVAVAALFFGCGRVPPEDFWVPNAADSAQIDTIVQQNKAFFKTELNELSLSLIDTVLPGSTSTILRDELIGNPFKQRFRADQMQHLFLTDSYDLEYSFVATIDTIDDSVLHGAEWVDTTYTRTTATVSMVETIPGYLNLHAYGMTDSLRETLFFPSPGETLRLPYYDSLMSPVDVVVSKRISGVSSSGCVLRKEGDAWKMWKVTGGTRFYAPNPDDAPYFYWIYLVGGGRTDTITLRPDTLHYGMQRFYSLDDTATKGVLTYTQNDTLRVSNLTTNNGDAATYLYIDGVRQEFSTTTRIPLAGLTPGLHKLCIEHVPAAVFWEVKGTLNAAAWSIPFRVKQ